MKFCEIWEKIKNEPYEVQDMVLASLEAQLNVRYKQIIEEKVKNMGKVCDEIPSDEQGRLNLSIFSDEEWKKLGSNQYFELDLCRKLHLYVSEIGHNFYEYYKWGVIPDKIEIIPILRDDVPYEDLRELFSSISYIIHKVYESELIDIDDVTLSNLKKLP